MPSSFDLSEAISIHALVKRATRRHKSPYRLAAYFNPRPREEGDRYAALAELPHINFNPRPREEGDV